MTRRSQQSESIRRSALRKPSRFCRRGGKFTSLPPRGVNTVLMNSIGFSPANGSSPSVIFLKQLLQIDRDLPQSRYDPSYAFSCEHPTETSGRPPLCHLSVSSGRACTGAKPSPCCPLTTFSFQAVKWIRSTMRSRELISFPRLRRRSQSPLLSGCRGPQRIPGFCS